MTGWKQHPVVVSRCWGEVKWVVWNGCVKVIGCESKNNRRLKGTAIDDVVRNDVGAWFVAGGVRACLWRGACDVGGGDGGGRARGGGDAWVAVVVVVVMPKRCGEMVLDQQVVCC